MVMTFIFNHSTGIKFFLIFTRVIFVFTTSHDETITTEKFKDSDSVGREPIFPLRVYILQNFLYHRGLTPKEELHYTPCPFL